MLGAEDREQAERYNVPRLNLKVSDFDILRRVGDGSFSTVILARHKASGQQYAVKQVSKHLVMRHKMVDAIRNERNILDKLQHVGVARMHFTFQDEESLYLGMEYCPGGELYEQLQRRGRLPLEDARFYTAQILLVLRYLREREVIHRDLKPENLLLTEHGHLKLIDFGSAKALFLPPEQRRTNNNNRATSFVGTAEYVSPEVLQNQGVSYSADLWALGCMIFQMLAGRPPFKGPSEYMTFQLVTARQLDFPEDFPAVARDLVDKLLTLDPDERLGANDIQEVMSHPFFEGIDWENIWVQPAPALAPSSNRDTDEPGLDWELSSMIQNSAPVRYEQCVSSGGGSATETSVQ